jgi:hypothetical protein
MVEKRHVPALRAVAEQPDRLDTANTTGGWSPWAGADDQDADTDPLGTSGPYDPTDKFDD